MFRCRRPAGDNRGITHHTGDAAKRHAQTQFACDVNQQDGSGRTPLLLAICLGAEEVAEQLIKATAPGRLDVNLGDESGLSPLMQAIEHRMTYVTYKLLGWPDVDLSAVDPQVCTTRA